MKDFPSRVAQSDVPKNKRWQMTGVWEMELDRVTRWLRQIANSNYGRLANADDAIEAGKGLPEQIVALFGAQGSAVDPRVLEAASLGTFERSAPSATLLTALSVLTWIAFSSEILLFLFMVILGFANPAVIVIGVLLAVSGYAIGSGVGNLMIASESGHGLKSFRGWTATLLGLLAAVGLSWLRARGVEDEDWAVAIGVPLILVLMIALFEALESTLQHKYKNLWDQMFIAQVWFSTEQHQERYKEGLWTSIYDGEIVASAKRVRGARAAGNV